MLKKGQSLRLLVKNCNTYGRFDIVLDIICGKNEEFSLIGLLTKALLLYFSYLFLRFIYRSMIFIWQVKSNQIKPDQENAKTEDLSNKKTFEAEYKVIK